MSNERIILKILLYYVVTFVFTILLGGIQQQASISSNMFILPQLAPGLSGLIVSFIFYRKLQIRNSEEKLFIKPALAFILPAVSGLLFFFILNLIESELNLTPVSIPSFLLLIWMPIGAIGEEIGWKGFMDRELENTRSLPLRAFIGGVLWALWHVGQYQNGIVFFLFFILLMVSYRYVLGSLTRKGLPLFCAVLFHWAINLGNVFLIPVIGELIYIIPLSITWFLIAAVFYLVTRNK